MCLSKNFLKQTISFTNLYVGIEVTLQILLSHGKLSEIL